MVGCDSGSKGCFDLGKAIGDNIFPSLKLTKDDNQKPDGFIFKWLGVTFPKAKINWCAVQEWIGNALKEISKLNKYQEFLASMKYTI